MLFIYVYLFYIFVGEKNKQQQNNHNKARVRKTKKFMLICANRYADTPKDQHLSGNPNSEFHIWLSRDSHLQNLPLSPNSSSSYGYLQASLLVFLLNSHLWTIHFALYILHLTPKQTLWGWCVFFFLMINCIIYLFLIWVMFLKTVEFVEILLLFYVLFCFVFWHKARGILTPPPGLNLPLLHGKVES